MPFGRKSPLEALALPGVILAYKYSQFRQRRREAASRRVTERELSALHHKIDKLLSKLEESEPEPPTSQEDECVICINARATMQTSPCGHRVVCRRCFVKTIQSAVAQRLLPLRCVICRTRVSRLTTGSGTFRLQGSSSSYSVGSKSWSVPGSASSYSVNSRVAASASLYSMSSGSSCMSNVSNNSNLSGASSKSGMSSVSSSTNSSGSDQIIHNHLLNQQQRGHNHKNHESCSSVGCLGAIPRNPILRQNSIYHSKLRYPDMPNRLPPIKEFRSPAKIPTPSPVHASNPKFRFSSYTQPAKPHEKVPLLSGEQSTNTTTSKNLKSSSSGSKLGMNSKIAPMNHCKSPINKKILNPPNPISSRVISSAAAMSAAGKQDEKADNKKNENAEKKKREDKLKLKAEKEARKEEKRIAKEEERLAKMLAKEEKKRGKKEAKEALLAAENGRK